MENFEIGELYYFGELWDGNGGESMGRELLEDGCVSPDEEIVVAFEIVREDEDILDVVVKVTDIY